MLEIYNEEIRDLLADKGASKAGSKHTIVHDARKGVTTVTDVILADVANVEQVRVLFESDRLNRTATA
eukprot:1176201-Prorocentrum_minimum.AAC.2